MKVPFVGPSMTDRSVNMNAQRTLNFYPEIDQSGKNVIALYNTPGLDLQATGATNKGRGAIVSGGDLYLVQGAKLYKYTTSWTVTTIGTLNTSSGVVQLVASNTQMLIVDGTDGYLVEMPGDTFSVISGGGFPSNPEFAQYLDGYFITKETGTERVYYTDDASTWDALDFITAEGRPDNITSMIVDHRELWLLGANTTEVWFNEGTNPDNPIQRMQGVFIETGCVAPYSTAKMDNSIFWLSGDDRGRGIVWKAEGYTPKRISNHALEFAIQGYSTISDAISWTQQQDGHSFYWITFPTADATWCFDASTNMWHERGWRDPDDGEVHRHRANCYVFFNGEHIVGDWEDGRIYALDLDTFDDDGDPMLSLRASGHIFDKEELRTMFHHRLQVDIEAGVGLSSGQGSDPQIMLRWSDDGGHTWSGYHYASLGSFAALGSIGEYKRRAIWNRLGQSRDRVYEISITDPVKRVIIDANLRTTMGTS